MVTLQDVNWEVITWIALGGIPAQTPIQVYLWVLVCCLTRSQTPKCSAFNFCFSILSLLDGSNPSISCPDALSASSLLGHRSLRGWWWLVMLFDWTTSRESDWSSLGEVSFIGAGEKPWVVSPILGRLSTKIKNGFKPNCPRSEFSKQFDFIALTTLHYIDV